MSYVENYYEIIFDISFLENNDYIIYLFKDQKFITYDKKVFTINNRKPYIELDIDESSNKLKVNIFNSINPLDWIGIFNNDETDLYDTDLLWSYVDNSDEIVFDIKSLENNDYMVVLFKDDDYNVYDSKKFSIKR